MTAVANRNDVRANPVFDSRRRFRQEDGEAGSGGLVPVIVASAGDAPPGDGQFGAAPSAERIEIALSSGLLPLQLGTEAWRRNRNEDSVLPHGDDVVGAPVEALWSEEPPLPLQPHGCLCGDGPTKRRRSTRRAGDSVELQTEAAPRSKSRRSGF